MTKEQKKYDEKKEIIKTEPKPLNNGKSLLTEDKF